MYGGTPWGYINEKKKNSELNTGMHELERENIKLKQIIKKLSSKQVLTEEETKIIKTITDTRSY